MVRLQVAVLKLVRSAVGHGFQPRDQHEEQQMYKISQVEKHEGKPPLSLAGTTELSLAGLYANKRIDPSELPLRIAAVSRCYRAEAGASRCPKLARHPKWHHSPGAFEGEDGAAKQEAAMAVSSTPMPTTLVSCQYVGM